MSAVNRRWVVAIADQKWVVGIAVAFAAIEMPVAEIPGRGWQVSEFAQAATIPATVASVRVGRFVDSDLYLRTRTDYSARRDC